MFLHKGLLRNNDKEKNRKKSSGVLIILNYIMILLHHGIAPIKTRRTQTRGFLTICAYSKHSDKCGVL